MNTKRVLVRLITLIIFYYTFLSSIPSSTGKKIPPCSSSFRPNLENLKRGILTINLHNPTHKTIRYSHFLSCPTLKVLVHAREHISVGGGKTRPLHYALGVSRKHTRKFPDQFEHKCQHVKWVRGRKDIPAKKCRATVRTYPGGVFLNECSTYKGKDLVVEEPGSSGGVGEEKSVEVVHTGNLTHYVANTSCVPGLRDVHEGNIYNHLKDGGRWRIPLPPNCSHTFDVDYSGTCRLSIYHMCQQRRLVADYTYSFYEGDVPQCIATRTQASSSWFNVITSQVFDDTAVDVIIAVLVMLFLLIFSLAVRSSILTRRHGVERGRIALQEEMQGVLLAVFCCQNRCTACVKEKFRTWLGRRGKYQAAPLLDGDSSDEEEHYVK